MHIEFIYLPELSSITGNGKFQRVEKNISWLFLAIYNENREDFHFNIRC
jgi:hypothetical protein